jgi:hypothetical protein
VVFATCDFATCACTDAADVRGNNPGAPTVQGKAPLAANVAFTCSSGFNKPAARRPITHLWLLDGLTIDARAPGHQDERRGCDCEGDGSHRGNKPDDPGDFVTQRGASGRRSAIVTAAPDLGACAC